MANCKQCNSEIVSKYAKKFCNSSCAASYNNKGVRRHAGELPHCNGCGTKLRLGERKYCSNKCQRTHERLERHGSEEAAKAHHDALNRERVSRYNAKKKSNTPKITKAELKLIQEFYNNCPDGHEVDHIYPISKGGWHVLSNLQYLSVTDNRSKSDKLLDNIAPWGYVKETELR